MKGIYYFIGKPDKTVYRIDRRAETFVKNADPQGKGGTIPGGDQPATFSTNLVIQA